MASQRISIATRGSPLALAQANLVLEQCRAVFPEETFELNILKTTGDKLQAASLANSELPKGLFTKELEIALLKGEADLAVHSLKDLPTELPAGLKIGAVGQRADVRDVLIYRHVEFLACFPDISLPVQQSRRGFKPEVSIRALPYGATIATSSARRRAQVEALRPDLTVVPIRGNVGTRLRKLAEQPELDALILAVAGLERLKVQMRDGEQLQGSDVPAGLAASRLSFGEMLPCVGQAAIGIEIRENDPRLDAICAKLNHAETLACVTAERAFLSAMGGGCQLAVAAYAEVVGQELRLRAASFIGGTVRRGEAQRPLPEARALGEHLAAQLIGS